MRSPSEIRPPTWALKLMRWFCDPLLLEDLEGDLMELYHQRHDAHPIKAKIRYWIDVLQLIRPGIVKNFQIVKTQINYAMFNNFLKVALRNSLHYKGYAALNLIGLVIGISSTLMIALWVHDELSVNRFHENGDSIYQLFRNMRQSNGMVETTTSIPKAAADLIREEYPEVAEVATFSWEMDILTTYDQKTSTEVGKYATPSFLNMFSFELLEGDKSTCLNDLDNIVISESMAIKKFGYGWRDQAVGQILTVESAYEASEPVSLKVSGVFKDIDDMSTMQFDWLRPAARFYSENPWVEDWGNGTFSTFITINDPNQVKAVADRVLMEIKNHTKGNSRAGDEELIIQKFTDTYLYSSFDNGVISGGRIDYVNIMTVVGILILIVACINFMNLTTARANRRSKEIGLRKVMGSHKLVLRLQFYFEAFLYSAMAIVLSIGIIYLTLPIFNELVGKSLTLDWSELSLWGMLASIVLSVTFLAGSYPALLLPNFKITQSLKGGIKQSAFASHFRRGMVVFQFGISMLLIIGTLIIYQQIDYVLNKDLGMNKENLLAIPMKGNLTQRLETYQNELLEIPEVKQVSAASGNPIRYGRSTSSANWEGKNPEEGYEINVIVSDKNFVSTMGIEIKEGRDFSADLNDSLSFIINETAAELMGFEEPVGKKLSIWGLQGRIIGVSKNFHMQNLYVAISPLIITCARPEHAYMALVRVEGDLNNSLVQIEEVTRSFTPKYDFEYELMEQTYADSYESEKTVRALIQIFAVIAVFIACMGVFGLASYSTEQRSREIGVRKVHGAGVLSILLLLSREYFLLMLGALLFAIPVGIYTAGGWLDNFEYHINVEPWVFLVAGVLAIFVGILTVLSKTYQAASANPVYSLRDE